jgi:hypothetical protein
MKMTPGSFLGGWAILGFFGGVPRRSQASFAIDAKPQGFDSPQTTSVEKLTDQPIHSSQPIQNRHRLDVREDGRDPFRPLGRGGL